MFGKPKPTTIVNLKSELNKYRKNTFINSNKELTTNFIIVSFNELCSYS